MGKAQEKNHEEEEGSEYKRDESVNEEENLSNYSAYVRREKVRKHRQKKRHIYRKKTHGIWKQDEEARFLEFLKAQRQFFENKQQRRAKKIFCKMTKYVQTRSSQQCRSHFQKYELRFITFNAIVSHIESRQASQLGFNVKIQRQDNVKEEVRGSKSKITPIKEEPENETIQKPLEVVKAHKQWTLKKFQQGNEFLLTVNSSVFEKW